MARKPKTIKDITRDPTLDKLLDLLHAGEISKAEICRRSGVSTSTITNWTNGKTRRPQNVTMDFTLRAMGYERVIQPLKR